jgi:hypothetical protein
MNRDTEFWTKEYKKKLLGRRIVGICVTPESDDIEFVGLKLDNGKVAWIQSDDEGNACGRLVVE